MKTQVKVALIGEVDAGKSTTLGQILLKTGSVLKNRVQEAERASQKQNKDFEPAFLLDAFEYERQNEMTVDITSVTCRWKDLDIRFLDTPGHQELSNKFIGGASNADLALLVLDSHTPFEDRHFRHAEMLRKLGLRDFAIIVNKWDSKTADEFQTYLKNLKPWLKKLDIKLHFVTPVTAKVGTGFDQLLQNIEIAISQLPTHKETVFIFKRAKENNQYWLSLEQGHFESTETLYDGSQPLDLTSFEWLGSRIAQVTFEKSPPLIATTKPGLIQSLKKISVSLVPLENEWESFDSLRTRWGAAKAVLHTSDSVALKTELPFVKDHPRLNFFTLEKNHRIVAVGVPQL